MDITPGLTPGSPLVVPPLAPGRRAVKLSMVVPTYNESQNIVELLGQMRAVLAAALQDNYELIVIDDDSPDHTWEIASALAAKDPKIKVLRRTGERGLATAVIRGWQLADGEVLGVIDGDLQHPPEVIAQLWSAMQKGADLVVASRRVEGGGVGDWNLARRIVSSGAKLIGLVLLPGVVGKVSDPMSGYFLVRRAVLEGVTLSPSGYKILIEVLGRSRARQLSEVGYIFRVREKGASKATLGVYGEYLLHLLRLRFQRRPASPPTPPETATGEKPGSAARDR